MKWYTYISISLVLFLGLLLIFQTETEPISLCFLILGSMFPLILEKLCYRTFEESHTLLLLIPFTLIGIINWNWVFAVSVGLTSHILIDTLSFDKPALFYPITKKHFSALNDKRKIEEGSSREKSFFIVLLTICFIFLIPMMQLSEIYDLKLDYKINNQENEVINKNNTIYSDKIQENVHMNIAVYGDQEKKVTIDDGKGNVTKILVENIPKNQT